MAKADRLGVDEGVRGEPCRELGFCSSGERIGRSRRVGLLVESGLTRRVVGNRDVGRKGTVGRRIVVTTGLGLGWLGGRKRGGGVRGMVGLVRLGDGAGLTGRLCVG